MKKIYIVLACLGGILLSENSWARIVSESIPVYCGWKSSGNSLELCCSSNTICSCNQHGVAEREVTLPLCSELGFSCRKVTMDTSLCNDDAQVYLENGSTLSFGRSYLQCPGHTFPSEGACNPSEYPSH